MNDSNQCPLCGLRTASERSTHTHLRSEHKRKEAEIAELLSKAKAGSLGCDPRSKVAQEDDEGSLFNHSIQNLVGDRPSMPRRTRISSNRRNLRITLIRSIRRITVWP